MSDNVKKLFEEKKDWSKNDPTPIYDSVVRDLGDPVEGKKDEEN